LLWRAGRLRPAAAHRPELQRLARCSRVRHGKVDGGDTAAEGFIRPDVEQVDGSPHGDVGEVENHIRALRPRDEELGLRNGGGQEAALVTDLPDGRSVLWSEGEDQHPGVAGVEDADAVAPLLYIEEGPGVAIDDHGVAEELRVPGRRDIALGNGDVIIHHRIGYERDLELAGGETLEEGAVWGIEQRAVRVEGPVLDHQRDLECPAGKHAGWEVGGAAAQQIESHESRVD